MNRKRLGLSLAGLLAVVSGGVYALPSAAQDAPPPIVAEPLTARAVFPDQVDLKIKLKTESSNTDVVNQGDPSRTVVVKYTVQPGAHFPWHTHLGPVVVNIVSGALTYQSSDDCNGKAYSAGQAFVDAGHGHVHSAFNAGSVPAVFIATFFGSPESGSLLIPADPGC
jgi:quercetin dioxygenase-like cupin family protein